MDYPNIGDGALLLTEGELRLVYGAADADHAHVGDLQQNSDFSVHIDIDQLVNRHFAIVGATEVRKSSGAAIILQKILDTRPNLRIFLVDPITNTATVGERSRYLRRETCGRTARLPATPARMPAPI